MPHRALLLTLATVLSTIGSAQERSVPPEWTQHVKPFRVMANIYYVGTLDLSSFLIASPEGHVLIDTGVEENADVVL
jgi:metallo-beta-lactamase class B